MAVRCAQCGEELMGAVNRCWRCGKPIVSQLDADRVPPLRRAPLPPAAVLAVADIAAEDEHAPQDGEHAPRAGEPVSAEVLPEPGEANEAQGRLGVAEGSPPGRGSGGGGGRAPRGEGQAPRRGSPFAASVSEGPVAGPPGRGGVSIASPAYPRNAAAVGGAVAAMVLGLMSLLASLYTNAALITALLALGMGVWGLYSTRRGLALAGIALCLLALLISGFRGAVDWYGYVYGRSPFEVQAPEAVDPAEWEGEPSGW